MTMGVGGLHTTLQAPQWIKLQSLTSGNRGNQLTNALAGFLLSLSHFPTSSRVSCTSQINYIPSHLSLRVSFRRDPN